MFGISYTLILIIITVIVSLLCFNNEHLKDKLMMHPHQMKDPRSYYRLLTSGFIHADYIHLFFNMFTLFAFGDNVEAMYVMSGLPSALFPIMYLTGLVASSLPDLAKHKNNYYFRSLGASGGVAAVLFAFIYFQPWAMIGVFFIPVPAVIFAALYLAYSVYMSKKGGDYINHDAHFFGAVYGFVFTLLFAPDHGRIF